MNQIRGIMLGASLEQNGGIATVEHLVLKYVPADAVIIRHVTSHDEGSITHRIIIFGKALCILLWNLICRKVDFVHIHLSDGGSVFRKAILTLVTALFGKPVLMHAHGAEFHSTYFSLPRWVRQILSWVFRQCQGFIVLSNTWADFYMSNLRLSEKRIFVLPNPVDLPTQIPDRRNSATLRFVFLGRIGQRKGAFDLIKAFARIPAAQKNRCELILAGDGEIEQGRSIAQSFNLGEQVTFLGWIDSEQRNEVLNQADVFILPSYNEGLPMALLEAMGRGLPVLTTPVGGIPEVIASGKNGLLVAPGEIQQLSEAMQLLIGDREMRLSLGTAARESVACYDIESYCRRLIDIYYAISSSLN